jgi:2-dehydro-3-deoxyphosphogluconate aldolase/(4S)-4-hydroxy-2-oxoglutarate aldolase
VSAGLPRGIIGVIRTDSSERARVVAEGWMLAGVPGVEVTLTVPDAESVIAAVAATGMGRVGAGTVVDASRITGCVAAGAGYIVAPDLNAAVVAGARSAGVPVVPGALTPSEMTAAVRLGADAVKVFPVTAVGGVAYLRAVLEPLPFLTVVASGGVRVDEVAAYLDEGVHAVCLGKELVDLAAAQRGDVAAIAEHASRVLDRCGVAPVVR